MNLGAKQFFYVMIAITVLSFGGIIGAFYWGDTKLKEKADTVSNLKTDYDIVQAKLTALSKAKQSTALSENAENLLDTLLPKEKQQEKLVVDVLYTATSEAGIPIANIGAITFAGGGETSDLSGTEQSKDIPGVYTYPFTMSVQEISYDQLLLLLKEIENNGRLVQVEDLQISPNKIIPGQISTVSLSLVAFLKP